MEKISCKDYLLLFAIFPSHRVFLVFFVTDVFWNAFCLNAFKLHLEKNNTFTKFSGLFFFFFFFFFLFEVSPLLDVRHCSKL